jgi:type II secretory pathway component PulK
MIDSIPALFRHRQSRARRGVALILVLVFLGLAALFATVWLVAANSVTHNLRLWEDRSQARWLAESGLDRAAAALAKDQNHAGNQWTIPANEFDGRYSATIKTAVHKSEDDSQKRAINAVVELQFGNETIVRTSKKITIDLPAEEKSK